MRSNSELLELIRQLKLSTSLHEQLRLLVRSWRIVKSLSVEERKELAKHVGFAEAETLLESLGTQRGISPTRLLKAIQKAEKSDFKEWRTLVQDLRNPDRRIGGIRKSAELVHDLVHEVTTEEETQEVRQAPPPPPRPVPPPGVLPPPPPPAQEAGTTEVLPAVPALWKPSPAPKLEPKSPAPPRPATRPEPGRHATPQEVRARDAAPTQEEQARSARRGPDEAPVGQKPSTKEARSRVTSAPQTPDTPEILQQISDEMSLIRRFRQLRRVAESQLDDRTVASVLQQFPESWARRRALSLLISAGCIEGTSSLLRALEQLPDPSDEVWCVSAWLRAKQSSQESLWEIQEKVRSERSRRMVQRALNRI